MRNILRGTAKFIMAFYVTAIPFTIAWEGLVDEKLYDCTDPVLPGYWTPGEWVGGNHWPVNVVPHVVAVESMGPDSIKEGWTVTGLSSLWSLFFAVQVAVCAFLTWLPWPRLGFLRATRISAASS